MKKLVLIGGHPKGYSEPFHPSTKSGKVLRAILAELRIFPELLNLWENGEQESEGALLPAISKKLKNFQSDNYTIIALGQYQYKVLKSENFECLYLPHPASRRTVDRQRLREGLSNLWAEGTDEPSAKRW